MKQNKEFLKVFLLHNVIAPYRLPLFERLSEEIDLEVYFCKSKAKGRKWDESLDYYLFKRVLLKGFDVGPFLINYELPFRLLKDKYDIYIVGEDPGTFFSTLVTLLYAKIFRKPFIVWSGMIETSYSSQIKASNSVRYSLTKMYRKLENLYQKFFYSQADAFIGYSRKTEEYLVERGANRDRIFTGGQVMPEELLFDISVKKSNTKFRKKKLILCLGYLQERKGIEYLIEAYKVFKSNKLALVIAGSGPDEERLKSLAEDRDDIYFVGYVEGEDKAMYYSIADVFVHPTLHDPSSHVINEAMYYGLPVITTTCDGGSEKIDGNGIVIQPENPKVIKESLSQILSNPKLGKKFRKRSEEIGHKYTDTGFGVIPFQKALELFINQK